MVFSTIRKLCLLIIISMGVSGCLNFGENQKIMSKDKKLFYKKLAGKWKATFSNEHQTVDVEVTFHDDSTIDYWE